MEEQKSPKKPLIFYYVIVILAILLIVLGLNIVFHSVKSYKTSEKGSEKAAV